MSGWVAGAVVVGSVASAAIGSQAAGKAAKVQAQAAGDAGVLQYQASLDQIEAQKEALDRQIAAQGATVDKQLLAQRETLDRQLAEARYVFETQRADLAPYREAGQQGQNQLMTLLGIGGNTGDPNFGKYATGEFTTSAYDPDEAFRDFTMDDFQADPGYAFRLKEGLRAVDQQAAARGGLISGNALKASQAYGQDMASQEYTNAFNRYQAQRGFKAGEFGNQFNRFQTERGNTLSPYQNLAASGQAAAAGSAGAAGQYGSAAGQALGGYGSAVTNAFGAQGAGQSSAYGAFGSNLSNIYGGTAANMSNTMMQGANARASGYVGQANAINQGISGITNSYYQNQLLNTLRTPEQRAIAQFGSANVFTPSGGGYVPSYVKDYAF
jgi:hypothetical protein